MNDLTEPRGTGSVAAGFLIFAIAAVGSAMIGYSLGAGEREPMPVVCGCVCGTEIIEQAPPKRIVVEL